MTAVLSSLSSGKSWNRRITTDVYCEPVYITMSQPLTTMERRKAKEALERLPFELRKLVAAGKKSLPQAQIMDIARKVEK